jgi:hypothetical protein
MGKEAVIFRDESVLQSFNQTDFFPKCLIFKLILPNLRVIKTLKSIIIMKKLFILIIIPFLAGCSAGVKKDLTTGLSISYNGFTVDDAYLSDGDGNKLGSNKITLGSKIMVVVTGVSNFKIKDGKAFPGCMVLLTDKAGNKVLSVDDVFARMAEGIDPEKAKELESVLTTGDPMKAGETYHLKTRFFDKQDTENKSEIVAEVDLVMQ